MFFLRIVALLVFCLAGALLSERQFASAATAEELKTQIESKNQEIKKIQEEIRLYNGELSKNTKTANTLKNKISGLNKNIANLKNQIILTEIKAAQKKLEIAELEILIADRQTAIREKEEVLGEILRALVKRENAGLFGFLLQGSGLSDIFGYFEQSENYQQKLRGAILAFRDLKRELEEDSAEAKARQKELKKIQAILADKKYISEAEHKEQRNLLSQTKNQEKRYQELLTETEKRFEEIQREIEELEEEFRKQVDPSSLPARREGFFVRPVAGRMSQGYGETVFASYSHFYKFHNGIDIVGATGTEVASAESGTVIAVGDSDRYCSRGAYGRYVAIDHGNNLITMYAHLSLVKVSQGQNVERGETIGYVGSTGRSTGSHLHFTVYDARTFALRQSRVCGVLPYGGSVNPLWYL